MTALFRALATWLAAPTPPGVLAALRTLLFVQVFVQMFLPVWIWLTGVSSLWLLLPWAAVAPVVLAAATLDDPCCP